MKISYRKLFVFICLIQLNEITEAQNTWIQKANLGGGARVYGRGASTTTKGYIVTGLDSNYSITNEFWEYDPAANLWIQKNSFPGASRQLAASFSIGNKVYVGSGMDDIM